MYSDTQEAFANIKAKSIAEIKNMKNIIDANPLGSSGDVDRIHLLNFMREISVSFMEIAESIDTVVAEEDKKIQDHIDQTESHISKLRKQMGCELEIKKPAASFAAITTKINPNIAKKHLVADGVYVEAFSIKETAECHKHKGFWCYNPADSRFWVSINGIAIPSFVTKVHQSDRTPIKFTEYDAYKKCPPEKMKDFYRPPEVFPGSRDIRHLTDRLRFCPASQPDDSQYIIRASDKTTLAKDITMLTNRDARLIYDVASHYMMLGFVVREHLSI